MSGIIKTIQKKYKGFYIDLRIDDPVLIESNGEQLGIVFVGKPGANKVRLLFNGPESFKITRAARLKFMERGESNG